MLSHVLTFVFFLLIGLEIRHGLEKPKDAMLPGICALGGMLLPAIIFISLNPDSPAWAVSMPTDVALAVGALSLLGKRIRPEVRFFLLTLAIADDFFSLVVIGIFFRSELRLESFIYTLGAAAIGSMLPFRAQLIRVLSPVVTFLIIPLYIAINLLAQLDLSETTSAISLSIIAARVVGKVLGISFTAWLFVKITSLTYPRNVLLTDIVGIGFLSGMGLTVSMVIAEITVTSDVELSQVRMGLFIAAVLSGLFGILWLKRSPVAR
jgi:Na+:H+ antiporter, NhaA family